MTCLRSLLALGGCLTLFACGSGGGDNNAADAALPTVDAFAGPDAILPGPRIDSLTATPTAPTNGETVTISVAASDPAGTGGALSYEWTVPAGYTIESGSGTAQIVTRARFFATGTAHVTVSNWDGSVTGDIAIDTVAGAWTTPALLDTVDNSATDPSAAVDGAGNVMVVWRQSDGTRNNVWASRFNVAEQSWSTPTLAETDDSGSAFGPQVASDPTGNAIAVWHQRIGGIYSIYASRFDVGAGTWTNSVTIDNSSAGASAPQVVVDASGNATVVWTQNSSIWANRFDATLGTWATATLIESDDSGGAFGPKLAVDANGNVTVVWSQFFASGSYQVYSNRFDAVAGTWSTEKPVETDATANGFEPVVAVDAAGNAVAAWSKSDGSRYHIWANRYDASAGSWATPVLIETNVGDTESTPIAMAMDPAGNATVVWYEEDVSPFFAVPVTSMWANRYNAASATWATAARIETDSLASAESPAVAADQAGNVVVAWVRSDDPDSDLWANRYDVASGTWGTAAAVDSSTNWAGEPKVVIGPLGRATVIWRQDDGIRDSIWMSRFR